MRIIWIAKRHYTGKDALTERYGRVWELPARWAQRGGETRLELLDYRGGTTHTTRAGQLCVASTPMSSPWGLRALWKRSAALRPDVIVASGDCFVGLAAWRLARSVGARFVFDIYDDYRTFGAYKAFFGWDAYGFLVDRADCLFFASQALAMTHSAQTDYRVVPNGIDPARFHPMDLPETRRQVGLDPNLRWIGYFGGLDVERGVDDLILATSQLHEKDPTIRLLLCGPARPGLRLDKPWIRYDGQVPHSRVPLLLNACDVLALPYRRGPTIDMANSCKIAEYLACKRPIVATDTPNLRANFPLHAAELGPAICRPGDPADLARALDFQLTHPRLASLPLEHTWEAIADRALEALHTCN
jgi:glycosyltransferase involved in cell wall biosynthesis